MCCMVLTVMFNSSCLPGQISACIIIIIIPSISFSNWFTSSFRLLVRDIRPGLHSFAVTYVRLLLESLLFPCFQAFLFLKISHVSFAVTYVRLLLESLLFPCFQAFLFLKISHVLLAFYIVLRYNKYYTKRNACHVPQKNT